MAGPGIWSGTISFSLVAIPVRLVRGVSSGRVSFHLLHAGDYARLARRMYCPKEDALVPPEEIVRGFELPSGRCLPVTEEELESVSPERSRTIEILEFVDADAIDPLYRNRPYYLVPLKGGEKAYRLLAEAMSRTGKAGLARLVLAEREHLVAVSSREGALALTTLHYAEELVPVASPDAEPGKPDEGLKEAMKASILGMEARFDPARHADERRRKLLALLERKAAESVYVQAPPAEEETAGPPDLMAALEEAMAQMRGSR